MLALSPCCLLAPRLHHPRKTVTVPINIFMPYRSSKSILPYFSIWQIHLQLISLAQLPETQPIDLNKLVPGKKSYRNLLRLCWAMQGFLWLPHDRDAGNLTHLDQAC